MLRLLKFLRHEKYPIIILLLAFITITFFTFNKWGHIIDYDNAREMLLPYWIIKGKVLYKDIYYFYGPIVPYFMALLYLIFNPGYNVLYFLGLFLTLLYLLILYYFSRNFLGRFASIVVGLLFLLQFAFFNTLTLNYIFPYSYGAVIGSLLSLIVLILVLKHYSSDNKIFLWAAATSCLVALFLKQDVTISCFGILSSYLFLYPLKKVDWVIENTFPKRVSSYISNFPLMLFIQLFGAITLLFLIIFSIIGYFVGYSNLFEGIFAFQIVKTELANYLNQELCRYDFNFENISRALYFALVSFIIYFGFILFLYYFVKIFKNLKMLYRYIFLFFFVLIFLVTLVKTPFLIILFENHRSPYVGLSFWLIGVLVYCFTTLYNKNSLRLLVITIAALLCIYRMFFNLELTLYAFYLLPISLVIFVYIFLNLSPVILSRDKTFLRSLWVKCSCVFLIIFVCYFIIVDLGFYLKKKIEIKDKFGTYYLFDKDSYNIYKAMELISKYIQNNSKSEDTILVMPEELYIYMLSDRLSSSKFYYLLPETFPKQSDYNLFVQHIEQSVPKLIVVSTKDYMEYGVGPIGSAKYYPEIMKSIENHYKKVYIIKTHLVKKPERIFIIYEKCD